VLHLENVTIYIFSDVYCMMQVCKGFGFSEWPSTEDELFVRRKNSAFLLSWFLQQSWSNVANT